MIPLKATRCERSRGKNRKVKGAVRLLFFAFMEVLLGLIWLGFLLALIGLILGLIRPVYSLWFLDRMNRLKVLIVYGLPILGLLFFYFLIKWLSLS